jgi:peroxiredoxin
VEVVAIGPQSPEQATSLGLPFPVLSDPDLKVTTEYGLLHPKGMGSSDVPRPTSLIVNKGDRQILWVHATPNIRLRPTPDEIFAALRR